MQHPGRSPPARHDRALSPAARRADSIAHLVNQAPGEPDALLHVAEQALGGTERRVVVQSGPDLTAHLLRAGGGGAVR